MPAVSILLRVTVRQSQSKGLWKNTKGIETRS